MVEVFKTNIKDKATADSIIHGLQKEFPDTEVNFDLEDCDKILRIHSSKSLIHISHIVKMIRGLGYSIELLK